MFRPSANVVHSWRKTARLRRLAVPTTIYDNVPFPKDVLRAGVRAMSEKYLYAIMHPNHALVASMLPPEEFGKHYTLGSSRFFHGQVLYAEIDVNYRHEFFAIDEKLADVKAKADGSPKRTKFIASYRVLEHIDLAAFKNFYVTSSVGKVLMLEKKEYDGEHQAGFIRTYQEICPLNMIILSYMDPPEFGNYMTAPGHAKGAPKLLFTQIDLEIDRFLAELELDPFKQSPLPNMHPHKLRDQILEVRANPNKKVKGISLDSVLGRISFTGLRTGFWIAHHEELVFYPIPTVEELEHDHYEWYRSLNQ